MLSTQSRCSTGRRSMSRERPDQYEHMIDFNAPGVNAGAVALRELKQAGEIMARICFASGFDRHKTLKVLRLPDTKETRDWYNQLVADLAGV